jgi:hypothetical protein
MKNLKVPDQVRTFNNLYQDALCQSQYHEEQRYGKRSDALHNATRVNRALFISKVMETAQQYETAPAHHQLSNRDVSSHNRPDNASGYNTLAQKSETMQQVSEEAEAHNIGGQQQ